MTLTIKEQDDKVMGVLAGRLDTLASTAFARDMQPLLDAADRHIILDCQNLEFISSSGLRLFLSLRKETIAKGGDVTITGVTDDIRSVFTITGFYTLFNFA